ncbi:MAG: hypothetical protein HXY49_03400 [Ignavibacteriaceae bacterium]|nr:hypothetical protein [Ignavibacteriaceae bacterium]
MILFWIKEAFKLIGRSKLSFILSLISISISVLLIIASIASIKLSAEYQKFLKQSIVLNLFLVDPISDNQLVILENEIKGKNFVRSFRYISKDEAAEIFIKETGEDFRKLLDYNPLPPSYAVTLKANYADKSNLDGIIKNLSKIPGVSEVIFKDDFIYSVLGFIDNIKKYVFVLTVVLILISVYIVYSTIKLIMKSKVDELETMKLVGASISTIKNPLILNSVITGFFASLIAVGIMYLLIRFFAPPGFMDSINSADKIYYLVIFLLIGPVLSLIVSIFALRNITLKV